MLERGARRASCATSSMRRVAGRLALTEARLISLLAAGCRAGGRARRAPAAGRGQRCRDATAPAPAAVRTSAARAPSGPSWPCASPCPSWAPTALAAVDLDELLTSERLRRAAAAPARAHGDAAGRPAARRRGARPHVAGLVELAGRMPDRAASAWSTTAWCSSATASTARSSAPAARAGARGELAARARARARGDARGGGSTRRRRSESAAVRPARMRTYVRRRRGTGGSDDGQRVAAAAAGPGPERRADRQALRQAPVDGLLLDGQARARGASTATSTPRKGGIERERLEDAGRRGMTHRRDRRRGGSEQGDGSSLARALRAADATIGGRSGARPWSRRGQSGAGSLDDDSDCRVMARPSSSSRVAGTTAAGGVGRSGHAASPAASRRSSSRGWRVVHAVRLRPVHRAALEFHHVDPAEKRFALSARGGHAVARALRAEARKCVLLCSNCHAEVESGVVALPVEC